MKLSRYRFLPIPALLWLLLPLGSGCRKDNQANASNNANGAPPVQVVAVEARRQAVIETLPLVGSLAPNEMVEIRSETDGLVEEICFKEGQRVEKGQLLLQLDETKLAAALAEAEASHKLSKATYERNRELRAQNLISQQEDDQSLAQYEAAEALMALRRRLLQDARIYAPFSGIMGARVISPGQVISRSMGFGGTVIAPLVDIDTVKAEFNVPERFIAQLSLSQKLELAAAPYPGEKFAGEVFFIAPKLDPDTRTLLVKARVPNPGHKLKPGMFVELNLTLRVREQAVVVPESALVLQYRRTSVFVVDTNLTANPVAVQTGFRMPGKVEVTGGLKGGELVVVEGTQKLRPGGKVVLAPAEAAAPYVTSTQANLKLPAAAAD